jgi:hypothetical protein
MSTRFYLRARSHSRLHSEQEIGNAIATLWDE